MPSAISLGTSSCTVPIDARPPGDRPSFGAIPIGARLPSSLPDLPFPFFHPRVPPSTGAIPTDVRSPGSYPPSNILVANLRAANCSAAGPRNNVTGIEKTSHPPRSYPLGDLCATNISAADFEVPLTM